MAVEPFEPAKDVPAESEPLTQAEEVTESQPFTQAEEVTESQPFTQAEEVTIDQADTESPVAADNSTSPTPAANGKFGRNRRGKNK